MPAAEKDKADKKKVMDVQKPGSSAAEASARPVIIGHKNTIQDPMVKNDAEAAVPAEAPEAAETPSEEAPVAVKPAAKKIIEPLNDVPKEEGSPAEPAAEKAADEPGEPPAPAEADAGSAASDAAAVDVLAEQAGTKKPGGKVSEEELKKQEHLQKLVEEKTYFVPIGKAHKKKTMLWVSVLLLAALVAAGYLAFSNSILDAGAPVL